MKKSGRFSRPAAILLLVASLAAFFIMPLVNRFVYCGVYEQELFSAFCMGSAVLCGLGLWRKNLRCAPLAAVLLVIGVASFFACLPAYTAAEAVEAVRSAPIYSGAAVSFDPAVPVMRTERPVSRCVDGVYRISVRAADGSDAITLSFNPVDGSFDALS